MLTIPLILAISCAPAARAEWTFQAGAGESFTHRSDLHIEQGSSNYTVHDVRWSGRGFEMPPWYDLRVTYFPSNASKVGFTAGLLHMKVYADTDETRRITGTVNGAPIDAEALMEDYVQAFSISHGVNYLTFGVIGRLQWQRSDRHPNGRIRPYAGLTYGPVINHAENRVNGQSNDPDFHQNGSFGTQGLIGVQYALSKYVAVYTELKRTHVSAKVGIEGGTARTTLNTTHAAAGLVYTF
jgi:lipid A oxidase